jgi:5-aminolevulinate synthase
VGVIGGYIAASAQLVDFIRSFGPGFIFTTSMPPAACVAAERSIQLIACDADRRMRLFRGVDRLRLRRRAASMISRMICPSRLEQLFSHFLT